MKSDLREEDALLQILFIITLEWVVKTANELREMKIGLYNI